jgi:hypothetical protein
MRKEDLSTYTTFDPCDSRWTIPLTSFFNKIIAFFEAELSLSDELSNMLTVKTQRS